MLKGKQKTNTQYPSKTSINFAECYEAKPIPLGSYKKLAGVILAAVAVIGLLCYPFISLHMANAKLDASVLQYAEAQALSAKYADIEKEYNKYFFVGKTDIEKQQVSCGEVIDIIENNLIPQARVESFAFDQNILSVNIFGISLEQTSTIIQALYKNPLVTTVTVFSADTETAGANASIYMTITLAKASEDSDTADLLKALENPEGGDDNE